MEAPKPKKRRWWRWAGLAAAGLVAAYLSAYFYGRWIPHNKATTHITAPVTADGRIDYIAAIEAELSKGVTPQNNAAVLLVQVIEPRESDDSIKVRLAAAGASDQRKDVKPLVGFESALPDVVPVERWKLQATLEKKVGRVMARPWSAEEHPDLAAVLARNEGALALVEEASHRSRVYLPRGKREIEAEVEAGGYWQWTPRVGDAVEQLRARAMLRVRDEPHLSVEDAMTLIRLGDMMAAEPSVFMLGGGAHAASAGERCLLELLSYLPDDVTLDIQSQVQRLGAAPTITRMLDKFSRWRKLDELQRIGRQPRVIAQYVGSRGPLDQRMVALAAPALPIRFGNGMRELNHVFDLAVVLSQRKTFAEFDAAIRVEPKHPSEARSWVRTLLSGEWFVANTIQSTRGMILHHHFERQAHRNALLVAVEVEAYKRKHGSYPETLEAIGAELPNDAITGKPIFYERTADGFELRLVGVDFKDDRTRAKREHVPFDARDVVLRVPAPFPETEEEEATDNPGK
jgi:hypothetical protein